MASDPGKMRPTTIRDARKLNLLPSVTTILKDVHKPFLESWKIEQAIRAALANPIRFDMESEAAHYQRIERESWSIVDDAAKRGTLIHEAIERFICYGEEPVDPTIAPLLAPYLDWHSQNVQAIRYTEKVCVHRGLGYAGRMDLKAEVKGRGECIIDFKSKKHGSDGKLAIYDEMAEQLRAYLEADALDNQRADNCLTIIIASDTPDCMVHQWPTPDLDRFWQAFQHLLSRWQLLKKYTPSL